MKSLKGLIKRKFGAIALASLIGLSGCQRLPQKSDIVYDKEINWQRVVYIKGNHKFIPPTPDQIRIYQDGRLEKVMEDFDGDGTIVNNNRDSYTERVNDNAWVRYTQLYVTEPYKPYESYDEIATGKEPKVQWVLGPQRYYRGNQYNEKLQKAGELYKKLKSEIQSKLESKKIQKLISKISY